MPERRTGIYNHHQSQLDRQPGSDNAQEIAGRVEIARPQLLPLGLKYLSISQWG